MLNHLPILLAAASRPIRQEAEFFDITRGEAMLLALGAVCTIAVVVAFIYILVRSRRETPPPADPSAH